MAKSYIRIADASPRKQSSAQDLDDDAKMEAALGCASCADPRKDCGPCSAELRREHFAQKACA